MGEVIAGIVISYMIGMAYKLWQHVCDTVDLEQGRDA